MYEKNALFFTLRLPCIHSLPGSDATYYNSVSDNGSHFEPDSNFTLAPKNAQVMLQKLKKRMLQVKEAENHTQLCYEIIKAGTSKPDNRVERA